MPVEVMPRRYKQQLEDGFQAIRRAYPSIADRDAEELTKLIVDVAEAVPEPQKEFARQVIAAADAYVQAYNADPNEEDVKVGIARRNLQELFRGTNPATDVFNWELRNGEGEIVGQFRGTRDEYHRVQRSVVT